MIKGTCDLVNERTVPLDTTLPSLMFIDGLVEVEIYFYFVK